MVRNYKKKGHGPPYSAEQLKEALKNIENGHYNIRSASRKYSIPFSTLQKRLRGTRGAKSASQGRTPAIPAADEQKLASGIKVMEKWGWGLSRKEIIELVGKYVKVNNIKTPFKNGIPGEDWFLSFKRRHNLSLKKPQSLEYARKKATDPFVIEGYFDILKQTLETHQLLDKPCQLYNIDETSFTLDPSKSKIVGQKNVPASRITSGPGRESTTVLMGGNANGDKLPPLIVFKGKNVWDTWIAPEECTYPGTSYSASPNGWMETEIFLNYFTKTFIPNAVPERPLLLVYDGHSTHLDNRLIDAAIENNIIILKLPPHSSHLLQPMDLAVFKSLKSRWDSKLTDYQRKHVGMKITKKDFSILLCAIWRETPADLLISGFRKGGIYPFNRSVVNRSKYDPEALHRYEKHLEEHQNLRAKLTDDSIPSTSTQAEEKEGEPLASENSFSDLQNPIPGSSNSKCKTKRFSFEDILLDTVRQSPRPEEKQKRKRLGPGAEIITAKENIERKKKAEQEKEEIKKAKLEEKKKRQKNIKTKNIVSSSSDEDVDIPTLSESESEKDESYETYAKNLQEEEKVEELLLNESSTAPELKIGSWVLVKFIGKKQKMFYVGQITAFNEQSQPSVMFLKKSDRNLQHSIFVWPEQIDHHLVPASDIELVLPEPNLGRRGELSFAVSFSSYNVL